MKAEYNIPDSAFQKIIITVHKEDPESIFYVDIIHNREDENVENAKENLKFKDLANLLNKISGRSGNFPFQNGEEYANEIMKDFNIKLHYFTDPVSGAQKSKYISDDNKPMTELQNTSVAPQWRICTVL